MFKAGSMGSYMRWIVDKSERESSVSTVDNPITSEHNAHSHIRNPSHVPFRELIKWILHRRPHDKRVYLCNPMRTPSKRAESLNLLFESDPDCLVINIHNNNDDLVQKYIYLNQVKTWAVSLKATLSHYEDFDTQYHPFDDEDKQRAMVWLYHNWREYFIPNPPITDEVKEITEHLFENRKKWKAARIAPHKDIWVDDYPVFDKFPEDQYIDLCVTDIVADDFIDKFSKILIDHNVGVFNFDYVREFHPTFQNAKPNKDWFNHIEKFRTTGEIDPWFGEHVLSQVFLLEELPTLPENWEEMTYDEIINEYKNDNK